MNSVQVDAARRVAVVGGGATWGAVDAATQQAGLAGTGADMSAVGVVGCTLGGGFGWLHRTLRLSCDNLLAAEIVTADAQVMRVSADERPDLWWALRGGGGNFGIVTALTFALHPVGPVHTASVICPVERVAEALGLYQDLREYPLSVNPPSARCRMWRCYGGSCCPFVIAGLCAGRGLR